MYEILQDERTATIAVIIAFNIVVFFAGLYALRG
jgi:hypothetical protein